MIIELDKQYFEKAIAGSQPSVVDFWAGWCMPCKIFAPILEDLADEMDGKANFYKVNIDEHGELAQRYNIASIPTLIFFQNGQVVDQMVGVRTKEEVAATLEKHL